VRCVELDLLAEIKRFLQVDSPRGVGHEAVSRIWILLN
jgi:hypothetical protein